MDVCPRVGRPGDGRSHDVADAEDESPGFAGQLHGGGTVIGTLHLVPLVLQIELHALHQQLLVVYHQYLHSCVSSVMM